MRYQSSSPQDDPKGDKKLFAIKPWDVKYSNILRQRRKAVKHEKQVVHDRKSDHNYNQHHHHPLPPTHGEILGVCPKEMRLLFEIFCKNGNPVT